MTTGVVARTSERWEECHRGRPRAGERIGASSGLHPVVPVPEPAELVGRLQLWLSQASTSEEVVAGHPLVRVLTIPVPGRRSSDPSRVYPVAGILEWGLSARDLAGEFKD